VLKRPGDIQDIILSHSTEDSALLQPTNTQSLL